MLSYENLNYKKLFELTNTQIKTLEDLVNSEPPESWEKNTHRQDKKGVHKDTQALMFKFPFIKRKKHPKDFNDDTLISRYAITTELFKKAAEVLNLKKYKVERYILAKLPAGKSILKHKDSQRIFGFSRRIHVPIITDSKCIFTVNDEVIPMDKGSAIEINNLLYHSVDNKSDIDRVHLIFDIKEDLS